MSDPTFLFTDIEGSTILWEQHPEAMQAALAKHDSTLHQIIESHHGRIFKTVGDSFYCIFDKASDALTAAIEAQHALGGGDHKDQGDHKGRPYDNEVIIRVRIALHTGPAEARNGDYVGPALNRVSRLLFAGHGGQILLSSASQTALGDHLPVDVSLRDMGQWQLKDLIHPEHIYQLLAPGLPSAFPALRSLEAFRTNLPTQLTSFVGREKEMMEIKQLVGDGARLTTLTGPGGAGKTRLSLQVAADLVDSFPDGVWFVELAPLTDPSLLSQTVAATLGMREEAGRTLFETITGQLRTKSVLIIFDNCEHLVEAVAQFVAALLQACPNLRILTSSREALSIPGESAYRVPSLSIPNVQNQPSAQGILKAESIQLFIERAKIVLPDFTLTDENAPALAQICSRLDGIPLAIELAAARMQVLKAEQIAERLNDRFRLLTGGSRNALPRQQTLRAMIDWSYDLLTERERILLRRLSVFADGWTLEAAESVCATKDEVESQKDEKKHPLTFLHPSDFIIHPFDILDLLAQLVNKSLVVTHTETGQETRYRLLETVRQYAREKLANTGEGLETRNQHLQYFVSLAERAEPQLTGPQVAHWLRRLELALDDIRAALEWSLNNDARLGLRIIIGLHSFWPEANYARDARYWLEHLLKQPEVQSPSILRARALGLYGYLLMGSAQESAASILEDSLALCEKLSDEQGAAFSMLNLGILLFQNGEVDEGRQLAFESLALYRKIDDKLGIVRTLHHLASNLDTNDYPRARAYLDESLAICREINYPIGIGSSLSDLGHLALREGDYPAARTWLEETTSKHWQLGKGERIVYSFIHLGELSAREGDYLQAGRHYQRSLFFARQTGMETTAAIWTHVKWGYTALWQNDLPRAGYLFHQALRQFQEIAATMGMIYSIEGVASLAVQLGQFEQSARLYAWADNIRENLDNLRPPVEQGDVNRDMLLIHSQLNKTQIASAQAQGRALSMEQAVAEALQIK